MIVKKQKRQDEHLKFDDQNSVYNNNNYTNNNNIIRSFINGFILYKNELSKKGNINDNSREF